MIALWFLRRATLTLFDSCSGLKLTLYWYTPNSGLVLNLKWFVSKVILPPVLPFLSTMCCGLVATSSTMSLDLLGGLCSWDTAIFAMAWVGGSACAGGGLWGAGAGTCAGGGPLDLPRPTGAACSRWASWGPSPGLRAASPPPPPRPRPLLLPLARPVMMSSSCHASETKKQTKQASSSENQTIFKVVRVILAM